MDYLAIIEQELDKRLPEINQSIQTPLVTAMRYALLGGGKRIRPRLVYGTGKLLDIDIASLHPIASAIEIIHVYSLIHDDLPAMDDDELRRHKPTVHIAFDEATAILAGDALQALAFEILGNEQPQLVSYLARASGHLGMAGGQAMDLVSENTKINKNQLDQLHLLKTGELIKASIVMPCLINYPINHSITESLNRFAECIGLAFQIQDDILDITSSTEELGKPQNSDINKNKSTYPELLGLEGAKQAANILHQEAMDILDRLNGDASELIYLTDFIVNRKS